MSVIHGRIKVMDGAGPHDNQQATIFAVYYFLYPPTRGVNVFRNRTGDGIPLGQLGRGHQTLNARSAEFIGFVHDLSQKFVASTAGVPEVMGITINQSLTFSSMGVMHITMLRAMIAENGALY